MGILVDTSSEVRRSKRGGRGHLSKNSAGEGERLD